MFKRHNLKLKATDQSAECDEITCLINTFENSEPTSPPRNHDPLFQDSLVSAELNLSSISEEEEEVHGLS